MSRLYGSFNDLPEDLLINYHRFVEERRKHLGDVALDLHHMTTGIAGEGGESLDVTKKLWIYEQTLETVWKDGNAAKEHLVEEVSDTLFYIIGLCNLLEITLLDLIKYNTVKLTLRYPTGYSNEAAKGRADKPVGDDRA
jgi:NTP pyrophosphatase (non-canonical NTP hydrolase)